MSQSAESSGPKRPVNNAAGLVIGLVLALAMIASVIFVVAGRTKPKPIAAAPGAKSRVKSTASRSLFERIEVENPSDSTPLDIQPIDTAGGGIQPQAAVGLGQGDWLAFKNIDLGDGATRVAARINVAGPSQAGIIEVRLGTPAGPVIAALPARPPVRNLTSSQQVSTYFIVEAPVGKAAAGVQDIYLTFNGARPVADVDWIKFSPPTRDAFSSIEARSFDDARGIRDEERFISYVDTGDFLKYTGVDFGAGGAKTFTAHVAAAAGFGGKSILVRLDSLRGPVIATLVVEETDSWVKFAAQSAALFQEPTGVHDVYLTFSGGGAVANIRQFNFVKE